MKFFKHILLSISILGFVANTSAQAPIFSMFDYSAKAGVSLSKLCNTDIRMAFYVGGAAEYYIDEILSVQPELIITGQGGRTKVKTEGARTVTSTRLTYLDVPVLFKVAPIPGSGLSFEAGPMMGFCVGGKMRNKTTLDSSINTTIKEPIYNNINKVQFGLCLGMSYVIDKNIGAQLRYNHGLTNAIKTSDRKLVNCSVEIGGFYLF